MTINQLLEQKLSAAIEALYGQQPVGQPLQLQPTRKEFTGDFTVIVFPLTRLSRKKPEDTGEEIGQWLVANTPEIKAYKIGRAHV